MLRAVDDAARPGDAAVFAALLRAYRLTAGLSQAALAERAGLSERGVSNLERGISRLPYPGTVGRLAEALGLDAAGRATLVAASRGKRAPTETPAQQTGQARIPRQRTSFVGRTSELAQVADLVEHAPLVTLVGPGGAGKTRLAVELAHALERRRPPLVDDGIRVAELANLTDSDGVVRAVADSLGVAQQRGRPLVETLCAILQTRRMLLVLDNCEHVVAASAELVDHLLNACPSVRVLATSREPFAIPGEHVFRVPPLGLAEDDRPEAIQRSDAVALFVQRAQAVQPQFALNATNAAVVSEICRRLDGLPLAVELAAAQTAAFAPADILEHLDRLLRTAGPARATPRRQHTLDLSLAWSYDLLDADEKLLFERLTPFSGGFDLEVAPSVGGPELDADTAFAVLARLVTRSMVQVEPFADAGGTRYRVLEPLRQYGRARLIEHDALAAARHRHAEYVLHLAELAGPSYARPDILEWSAPLYRNWDNVRAAFDWAVDTGATDVALRLSVALWWWWSRPDYQAEARTRLERVLALPHLPPDRRLRQRVVGALAFLATMQSDMPVAERLASETLEVARATSDTWLESFALLVQSMVHAFQGRWSPAKHTAEAGLALARRDSLDWLAARHLDTLGHIAMAGGDFDAAADHFRASEHLARARLDAWSVAMALTGLADLLRSQGDTEHAGRFYAAALPTFRTLHPRHAPQGIIHNLAYVELGRGHLSEAARMFLESAELYANSGADRRGVAECVMGLASVAVGAASYVLAARLYGAAERALEVLETAPTPSNLADHQRGQSALRAAMAARALAESWQLGRSLSLEDALHQARALTIEPATPHRRRVTSEVRRPR